MTGTVSTLLETIERTSPYDFKRPTRSLRSLHTNRRVLCTGILTEYVESSVAPEIVGIDVIFRYEAGETRDG